MSDYEIQRERIVEREVPIEGRRTVVEHRRGGMGYGAGFNPVSGLIMALVLILLVLLVFGVLV